jgi:hypothetical protein
MELCPEVISRPGTLWFSKSLDNPTWNQSGTLNTFIQLVQLPNQKTIISVNIDATESITPDGNWNNWKIIPGSSASYNTVVPSSTTKFIFNAPKNDTSIITINKNNEKWGTLKFVDQFPSFGQLPGNNIRQLKPYLNNWVGVDTSNCIQFSMDINNNAAWIKSPDTNNIQYCTVLNSGDLLAVNVQGSLWRGVVNDFRAPIQWIKIALLPGMKVLKAYQLNDCVAILTYELALYTTKDLIRWTYVEGTFGKVGSLLELKSPLSGYVIVCRAQPEYTLPVPENPNEPITNEDDKEILFKGKAITNEQAVKAFEYAYPETVKKMNEALDNAPAKVERAAARFGGAKVMQAAAEKVLSERFKELKPPPGTSKIKKGLKSVKAMASQAAADLIFDNVPGAKDVFMMIFPDPVGPFLMENIYLLIQAVGLLAAIPTLPVTLPPFLVQVGIAIALYAIEKNLQEIMKGLEDAANFIAGGLTNAYNEVSRGVTNAYNDASRDLTTFGLATATAFTDLGNTVATGATNAYNDAARDLTNVGNTVAAGATKAAELVAREAERLANEARKEAERLAEETRKAVELAAREAERIAQEAARAAAYAAEETRKAMELAARETERIAREAWEASQREIARAAEETRKGIELAARETERIANIAGKGIVDAAHTVGRGFETAGNAVAKAFSGGGCTIM